MVNTELLNRRPSKKDRRSIEISLSMRGTKAFCRIEERMNKTFQKMFQEIPQSKQSEVLESLTFILKSFDCLEDGESADISIFAAYGEKE